MLPLFLILSCSWVQAVSLKVQANPIRNIVTLLQVSCGAFPPIALGAFRVARNGPARTVSRHGCGGGRRHGSGSQACVACGCAGWFLEDMQKEIEAEGEKEQEAFDKSASGGGSVLGALVGGR